MDWEQARAGEVVFVDAALERNRTRAIVAELADHTQRPVEEELHREDSNLQREERLEGNVVPFDWGSRGLQQVPDPGCDTSTGRPWCFITRRKDQTAHNNGEGMGIRAGPSLSAREGIARMEGERGYRLLGVYRK